MSDFNTPINLKKAYIQVLNPNGTVNDELSPIPVFFNPSEYTIDKTNEFSTSTSGKSAIMQFSKENLKTLTMDLIFDSYEENEDVRILTNKITDLLRIDSEIDAPPIVTFVWGGPILTGVLTNVKQRFTLFNSDGIPLRATLTTTFKEYQSESSNVSGDMGIKIEDKVHTVKLNEDFQKLANTVYNNPAKWREIADINGINNPRNLKPGSKLIIPKD